LFDIYSPKYKFMCMASTWNIALGWDRCYITRDGRDLVVETNESKTLFDDVTDSKGVFKLLLYPEKNKLLAFKGVFGLES